MTMDSIRKTAGAASQRKRRAVELSDGTHAVTRLSDSDWQALKELAEHRGETLTSFLEDLHDRAPKGQFAAATRALAQDWHDFVRGAPR